MPERRFDALAKTIGDGSGSRRRALQIVGAALAGAAPLARVSGDAAAGSAQKRCKQKGGAHLAEGACHCAYTANGVGGTLAFPCNGDANCACWEAAATGHGFCGSNDDPHGVFGCVCNGCPAGQMCIVYRGLLPPTPCTTTKECRDLFPNASSIVDCIAGSCQTTACVAPCPTQP